MSDLSVSQLLCECVLGVLCECIIAAILCGCIVAVCYMNGSVTVGRYPVILSIEEHCNLENQR